ncbi:hypothetical protein BTM449_02360 [Helicobacter pylori]
MKDSVIIIESPNKVAKIKEITGAKVFATIGHLCNLKAMMKTITLSRPLNTTHKRKNVFLR